MKIISSYKDIALGMYGKFDFNYFYLIKAFFPMVQCDKSKRCTFRNDKKNVLSVFLITILTPLFDMLFAYGNEWRGKGLLP